MEMEMKMEGMGRLGAGNTNEHAVLPAAGAASAAVAAVAGADFGTVALESGHTTVL